MAAPLEVWEAGMDEWGRVYHYCAATGESRWPREAPGTPAPPAARAGPGPGGDPALAWEQRRDAASGTPYIFNRLTGEALWGRIRGAVEAPSPAAAPEVGDWLEVHTPRGQRYYVALASRTASWSPPEPGAGRIVHLPPPPEGAEEPHPEHWRALWQAELERHRQRKAAGLPVPTSPPPEAAQATAPEPPPRSAAAAPAPPAPPPPAHKPRAPSFHPSLMMAFEPDESNGAEETVMNRLPSRRG